MTAWKLIKRFGSYCVYSRINSTKYPASGAVNVSEARLMSQDGRVLKVVYAVCVDQCVSAVGAVEVPVFVCLRSRCSHVTEVGGL